MTSLITLPRMATVLGALDNLDVDGTAGLHNRLRNLARKGFLFTAEDPNATATSAKLFDPIEIARARILADAVLGGIDGDGLKAVADALSATVHPDLPHPDSAKVEGGFTYGPGLETALRGVRAGERWLLRLRGRIQPDGSVSWKGWVALAREGKEDSACARDTLNRQAPTFFTAELDFRVRLTPLLDLIGE